ncbi:MAG TPA: cytochrome c biogenesis protein CcsA [Candidatus Baltobacteraceae bacterium]|nr:cytochrome c biogenesis protein CcsA [Candidatus Baltobacteraceae bacterium]
MPIHLAYLSLALYAASFVCYARILYAPNLWLGRLATVLLAAAIAAHYFALLDRAAGTHTIPYDDLYGSMSLFAWLLGITYLGLELIHRQRSVGACVTLFMVIWLAGLETLVPKPPLVAPPARGALFALHVTLNTWAYSAFALSFVLSLVYIVQDRVLRSRHPSAAFWRFPALDVLDRMARSSVYIGLAALAVGVVSGMIWAHRLTGTYPFTDPKFIVTIAILAVYVTYLRLSRSVHWRGARAATICALNFAIVLFSYTIVNLYLTGFHRFY